MKKIYTFCLLTLWVAAGCGYSPKTKLRGAQTIKGTVYGDSVLDNNIQDLESMFALLQNANSTKIKLKATVNSVNKDGCGILLKCNGNDDVRVAFADNSFNVPTTIIGKEVIIDGEAKVEELSVQNQKQFALNEGKNQESIDEITTVKKIVALTAKGLVVM